MTSPVSEDGQRERASAFCIAQHLRSVIIERCDRCAARQDGCLPENLRRIKLPCALLQIRHGTSDAFRRQLEREIIVGLEQDALCGAESLPHCAVGCLPEIAALRMLQMCFSADQRDLHIGDRAARQCADMCFFQ